MKRAVQERGGWPWGSVRTEDTAEASLLPPLPGFKPFSVSGRQSSPFTRSSVFLEVCACVASDFLRNAHPQTPRQPRGSEALDTLLVVQEFTETLSSGSAGPLISTGPGGHL